MTDVILKNPEIRTQITFEEYRQKVGKLPDVFLDLWKQFEGQNKNRDKREAFDRTAREILPTLIEEVDLKEGGFVHLYQVWQDYCRDIAGVPPSQQGSKMIRRPLHALMHYWARDTDIQIEQIRAMSFVYRGYDFLEPNTLLNPTVWETLNQKQPWQGTGYGESTPQYAADQMVKLVQADRRVGSFEHSDDPLAKSETFQVYVQVLMNLDMNFFSHMWEKLQHFCSTVEFNTVRIEHHAYLNWMTKAIRLSVMVPPNVRSIEAFDKERPEFRAVLAYYKEMRKTLMHVFAQNDYHLVQPSRAYQPSRGDFELPFLRG